MKTDSARPETLSVPAMHSAARAGERVSFAQNLAYAAGSIAMNLLSNGVATLALPIYNVGLGVSASLISLALGIPRIWDALLDPFMGHISDNTRSRWGRRRPYIVVAGLLSGVVFALVWLPDVGWSKMGIFAYFLGMSILYYTLFMVWSIPYGALGLELTYDYHERTRVQSFRTFVMCLFALILPWLYKMCFWSWGKLVEPGVGSIADRLSALLVKPALKNAEVYGVRTVGVIIGAVILISAVLPALCREKPESQSQPKIHFLPGLKTTCKNKPYMLLTISSLISSFGLYIANPMAFYLNVYFIYGGDKTAAAYMGGWSGTAWFLSGLVSVPFAAMAAKRLGKKQAYILGFSLMMLGYISTWWFFTPSLPWIQIFPFMLIGPAWSISMITLPSMIADVCDLDELDTGLRREGMYGAVNNWIVKSGAGLATCLTGFIVTFVGLNPLLAQQAAETMYNMRVAFVGIPCVFIVLSIIIVAYYPLTEARALEVRAILDDRKRGAEHSIV